MLTFILVSPPFLCAYIHNEGLPLTFALLFRDLLALLFFIVAALLHKPSSHCTLTLFMELLQCVLMFV